MSAKIIPRTRLEKVTFTRSRPAGLPVRGDLVLVYAASFAIALLVAVAAAAGLIFRTAVYPTEAVMLAFLPVDLFHLVVGVPVLLGSMGLARQGHLAGLLCWPGALLYVLYSYVTNLLGVPFGVLFLPYLLLVILSAYTLIVLVASMDGEAIRRRLAGRVPARAAGGFLTVLTSLFFINATVEIGLALVSQHPVGPLDLTLWIADLTTIGPVSLVGGILLWRHRTVGYAGSTGLLLAYGMLFLGLLPVMIFPALYAGGLVDGTGIGLMLGAGLVCLTLMARFVRAAAVGETQTQCSSGS